MKTQGGLITGIPGIDPLLDEAFEEAVNKAEIEAAKEKAESEKAKNK